MKHNNSFTVYNASAGSGKTYTLVKEFLKVLFQSNNKYLFKSALAITFTNKAVAEMKDRIINTLKEFSKETILEDPSKMFEAICSEMDLSPEQLHLKAKTLLHTIVHNYAAFNISTIDGFTHNLLRTFAYDLKLPLHFEVDLDQEALLNEAVNNLIAQAGEDQDLTKILVDFAIEKADDDKSWDIAYDFNTIGKLLFNENHIPYVKTLTKRNWTDFKVLKQHLQSGIAALESQIVHAARKVLTLIHEAGLEYGDFTSSYLPKHFTNLSNKKFDINFNAKWQEDIAHKTLFPKRVSPSIASVIENIQPQLANAFYDTKQDVFQLKFLTACYKNITPLSVLNAISNELEVLKADQNKLLISEFNSIISNEIKNQPIPFIYERLGEKFRHYFVDEFQDTSKLQWQNLIPLIDNTLSSENGSALIVGDAKQAIYRWRGGVAEQFIHLFNETSQPFQIKQDVQNLQFNFRSYTEIVNFNNGLFSYLSDIVFSDNLYKKIYSSSGQKPTSHEQGYVELSFLNIEKEDDRDALYADKVLQTIEQCLQNGFALKDICILTRYKKDEKHLASFLAAQDHLSILSEDGLMLSSSPEIAFVHNVLCLLTQPKNNSIKIQVLSYLTSLFEIVDKHAFFTKHINQPLHELFSSFEVYKVYLSYQNLLELPLYELVETLVRQFHLVKHSNAYMQSYLDVVLEFSNTFGSDIMAFIAYFDKKKNALSIASPKTENAIQIMTIHKSKGLEFPVVIFPFADLDIYSERDPKEWVPIDPETYAGFTHALLNFNRDFEHFGSAGKTIYDRHRSMQELDHINLLYVALTRAKEQLYILSKNDAKSNTYSGMLIDYLQHLNLWQDHQFTYRFGTAERPLKKEHVDEVSKSPSEFISTDKKDHNIKIVTKSGVLWNTHQEEAIEKGNLVHHIMAQIRTKEDVDFAINDSLNQGMVNGDQAILLREQVLKIIEHPDLAPYFNANLIIYNEQDIITNQNVVLRPDRVVINASREAVIIDYKTGLVDEKHRQQLNLYQEVLEHMSYRVKKKFLVYINKDLVVHHV
ncbi:UvrD-helicase domain-containing protein [Aestuariivivens sediminis]|uniref:UvrD-helicase domain-containing protein n=1 Tax=Aestuariivivens sediminis TaxID=2913557 RepID=UPI001F59A4EC|nr:UvrD-helicase domain-containing protein [Aestuariivivens sediminis]